jgi:4-hydroxybutyrate dehydrogenase/sulfolactaldehyde 3-reductase
MDMIGFVGLGRMGRPMASNLCRKGFRLVVHDIAREAVAELEALQARGARSAAEVAEASGIMVMMLPDSAVVAEVACELLRAGKPGSLLMDMSTVGPETTDALARSAAQKGIAFVDAPVGRLARVKPLLEAMGTTIHHCGPAGSGTRTKLVNNYLAVSSCQLNAEALALSERFGLDLERTLEVLYGTTAFNGQLKINWPAKVLKGDVAPGFTIDLAHKDLSLIMEAANAARVPMPMGAAAREAFSAARAGGWGGKDFSAMLDAHCAAAGIGKVRLKG